MKNRKDQLFSIFAEKESYSRPLILTHLTYSRLIDDIVVPYRTNKPFFIDGVPIKRDEVKKIKIIRQRPNFEQNYLTLHYGLQRGDRKRQKIYGEQYYTRLEALLRYAGEDVTSQIVKAFDQTILKKIKQYIPKKEELIAVSFKLFSESQKIFNSK